MTNVGLPISVLMFEDNQFRLRRHLGTVARLLASFENTLVIVLEPARKNGHKRFSLTLHHGQRIVILGLEGFGSIMESVKVEVKSDHEAFSESDEVQPAVRRSNRAKRVVNWRGVFLPNRKRIKTDSVNDSSKKEERPKEASDEGKEVINKTKEVAVETKYISQLDSTVSPPESSNNQSELLTLDDPEVLASLECGDLEGANKSPFLITSELQEIGPDLESADRLSESTLSADEIGDSSLVAVQSDPRTTSLDHSYALNTQNFLNRFDSHELSRQNEHNNDKSSALHVYRALLDHSYTCVTPSALIEALKLKHDYVCAFDLADFPPDTSFAPILPQIEYKSFPENQLPYERVGKPLYKGKKRKKLSDSLQPLGMFDNGPCTCPLCLPLPLDKSVIVRAGIASIPEKKVPNKKKVKPVAKPTKRTLSSVKGSVTKKLAEKRHKESSKSKVSPVKRVNNKEERIDVSRAIKKGDSSLESTRQMKRKRRRNTTGWPSTMKKLLWKKSSSAKDSPSSSKRPLKKKTLKVKFTKSPLILGHNKNKSSSLSRFLSIEEAVKTRRRINSQPVESSASSKEATRNVRRNVKSVYQRLSDLAKKTSKGKEKGEETSSTEQPLKGSSEEAASHALASSRSLRRRTTSTKSEPVIEKANDNRQPSAGRSQKGSLKGAKRRTTDEPDNSETASASEKDIVKVEETNVSDASNKQKLRNTTKKSLKVNKADNSYEPQTVQDPKVAEAKAELPVKNRMRLRVSERLASVFQRDTSSIKMSRTRSGQAPKRSTKKKAAEKKKKSTDSDQDADGESDSGGSKSNASDQSSQRRKKSKRGKLWTHFKKSGKGRTTQDSKSGNTKDNGRSTDDEPDDSENDCFIDFGDLSIVKVEPFELGEEYHDMGPGPSSQKDSSTNSTMGHYNTRSSGRQDRSSSGGMAPQRGKYGRVHGTESLQVGQQFRGVPCRGDEDVVTIKVEEESAGEECYPAAYKCNCLKEGLAHGEDHVMLAEESAFANTGFPYIISCIGYDDSQKMDLLSPARTRSDYLGHCSGEFCDSTAAEKSLNHRKELQVSNSVENSSATGKIKVLATSQLIAKRLLDTDKVGHSNKNGYLSPAVENSHISNTVSELIPSAETNTTMAINGSAKNLKSENVDTGAVTLGLPLMEAPSNTNLLVAKQADMSSPSFLSEVNGYNVNCKCPSSNNNCSDSNHKSINIQVNVQNIIRIMDRSENCTSSDPRIVEKSEHPLKEKHVTPPTVKNKTSIDCYFDDNSNILLAPDFAKNDQSKSAQSNICIDSVSLENDHNMYHAAIQKQIPDNYLMGASNIQLCYRVAISLDSSKCSESVDSPRVQEKLKYVGQLVENHESTSKNFQNSQSPPVTKETGILELELPRVQNCDSLPYQNIAESVSSPTSEPDFEQLCTEEAEKSMRSAQPPALESGRAHSRCDEFDDPSSYSIVSTTTIDNHSEKMKSISKEKGMHNNSSSRIIAGENVDFTVNNRENAVKSFPSDSGNTQSSSDSTLPVSAQLVVDTTVGSQNSKQLNGSSIESNASLRKENNRTSSEMCIATADKVYGSNVNASTFKPEDSICQERSFKIGQFSKSSPQLLSDAITGTQVGQLGLRKVDSSIGVDASAVSSVAADGLKIAKVTEPDSSSKSKEMNIALTPSVVPALTEIHKESQLSECLLEVNYQRSIRKQAITSNNIKSSETNQSPNSSHELLSSSQDNCNNVETICASSQKNSNIIKPLSSFLSSCHEEINIVSSSVIEKKLSPLELQPFVPRSESTSLLAEIHDNRSKSLNENVTSRQELSATEHHLSDSPPNSGDAFSETINAADCNPGIIQTTDIKLSPTTVESTPSIPLSSNAEVASQDITDSDAERKLRRDRLRFLRQRKRKLCLTPKRFFLQYNKHLGRAKMRSIETQKCPHDAVKHNNSTIGPKRSSSSGFLNNSVLCHGQRKVPGLDSGPNQKHAPTSQSNDGSCRDNCVPSRRVASSELTRRQSSASNLEFNKMHPPSNVVYYISSDSDNEKSQGDGSGYDERLKKNTSDKSGNFKQRKHLLLKNLDKCSRQEHTFLPKPDAIHPQVDSIATQKSLNISEANSKSLPRVAPKMLSTAKNRTVALLKLSSLKIKELNKKANEIAKKMDKSRVDSGNELTEMTNTTNDLSIHEHRLAETYSVKPIEDMTSITIFSSDEEEPVVISSDNCGSDQKRPELRKRPVIGLINIKKRGKKVQKLDNAALPSAGNPKSCKIVKLTRVNPVQKVSNEEKATSKRLVNTGQIIMKKTDNEYHTCVETSLLNKNNNASSGVFRKFIILPVVHKSSLKSKINCNIPALRPGSIKMSSELEKNSNAQCRTDGNVDSELISSSERPSINQLIAKSSQNLDTANDSSSEVMEIPDIVTDDEVEPKLTAIDRLARKNQQLMATSQYRIVEKTGSLVKHLTFTKNHNSSEMPLNSCMKPVLIKEAPKKTLQLEPNYAEMSNISTASRNRRTNLVRVVLPKHAQISPCLESHVSSGNRVNTSPMVIPTISKPELVQKQKCCNTISIQHPRNGSRLPRKPSPQGGNMPGVIETISSCQNISSDLSLEEVRSGNDSHARGKLEMQKNCLIPGIEPRNVCFNLPQPINASEGEKSHCSRIIEHRKPLDWQITSAQNSSANTEELSEKLDRNKGADKVNGIIVAPEIERALERQSEAEPRLDFDCAENEYTGTITDTNGGCHKRISSDQIDNYSEPPPEKEALPEFDYTIDQDWRFVPYEPPPRIIYLDKLIDVRLGTVSKTYRHLKNGRPSISLLRMVAMAIENTRCKFASLKEVVDFILKYFPYFRTTSNHRWTITMKRDMHSSSFFRKIFFGRDAYYSFSHKFSLTSDHYIFDDEDDDTDVGDRELDSESPFVYASPQLEEGPDSAPEHNPLVPVCNYSDDEASQTSFSLKLFSPAEVEPVFGETDNPLAFSEIPDPPAVNVDRMETDVKGKSYTCFYCSSKFSLLSDAYEHALSHPQVLKRCPACGFSSPDRIQFSMHVYLHKTPMIQC